jgi:hypothetical protein
MAAIRSYRKPESVAKRDLENDRMQVVGIVPRYGELK